MTTTTPAGWYPVDATSERYWDGGSWSDHTRPISTVTPPPPAKKKRRVFLWVFLGVQALFIIWLIAGVGGNASDAQGISEECRNFDPTLWDSAQECNDFMDGAAAVGTGIGVMLIVGLWMVVDFFLAVIYGIYRLAKRT